MSELKDIALTEDGDLDFGIDDLNTVESMDFYKQCAINRIKSITVDWFEDHIGADLEELMGLPNTRENAKLGEDKIIHTLTDDALFSTEEVSVKSFPSKKDRIGYEITIFKQGLGQVKLNVALDLVKGVTIGV